MGQSPFPPARAWPRTASSQDCIETADCIDFKDLGMEAIWRIDVQDFPAFIIIDNKGNDFFQALNLG